MNVQVKTKDSRENSLLYQKPVFEKQEGLTFPLEIIEKLNGGRLCVQCSSCHGCK